MPARLDINNNKTVKEKEMGNGYGYKKDGNEMINKNYQKRLLSCTITLKVISQPDIKSYLFKSDVMFFIHS